MKKSWSEANGLRVYGALFLLLVANIFVVWMVIDDGHDWRGDFAMYISQGQALLDGSISELYEMNKYAMDNSETNLGPYLYQFGFPSLLAVVLAFFGLNFYVMKALCAAGLVFSIPLIYKLVREHFKLEFYPFLIVFTIVFHASYVVFANSVLSDLPFLFFCLMSLKLMTHRPTLPNQIVLGLFIYFSYSIRDIGIVLILTLMVLHFQGIRNSFVQVKNRYFRLIPYAIFVALFAIGSAVLPPGQENHLKALVTENNWASILDMLGYYQELLSRFFYITKLPKALFWMILGLIILGIFPVAKRTPHLLAFTGLSFLILIFWPYKQGLRFLFPLLPFLMLFLFKGIEVISDSMSFGRKLKPPLLLTITLVLGYQSFGEIKQYAARDTNLCYTEEMKELYGFVSSEIPSDKVVAHYYPRVFRLFTGVNAVRQSQYEFDLRTDIDYFHGNKHHTDPNIIAKYKVVYKSENEIILAKEN